MEFFRVLGQEKPQHQTKQKKVEETGSNDAKWNIAIKKNRGDSPRFQRKKRKERKQRRFFRIISPGGDHGIQGAVPGGGKRLHPIRGVRDDPILSRKDDGIGPNKKTGPETYNNKKDNNRQGQKP